jgi:L-aspartate oxidase
VFARRIAARLRKSLPPRQEPAPDPRPEGLVPGSLLGTIQQTMTERAGVLRSADGLRIASSSLAALTATPAGTPDTEAWEATNVLTTSAALVAAAWMREETRGSHWREDFPDKDDSRWFGHIDVTLEAGSLAATYHPVTPDAADAALGHAGAAR